LDEVGQPKATTAPAPMMAGDPAPFSDEPSHSIPADLDLEAFPSEVGARQPRSAPTLTALAAMALLVTAIVAGGYAALKQEAWAPGATPAMLPAEQAPTAPESAPEMPTAAPASITPAASAPSAAADPDPLQTTRIVESVDADIAKAPRGTPRRAPIPKAEAGTTKDAAATQEIIRREMGAGGPPPPRP
jgi:hypothetical protein